MFQKPKPAHTPGALSVEYNASKKKYEIMRDGFPIATGIVFESDAKMLAQSLTLLAQRDALIAVAKEAMRWWASQVASDISLIPATPAFYKTAKAALNLCSEGRGNE